MPDPSEHAPIRGLSAEELEAEHATDLPEREALSIVDPGVFSVTPVPIGRTADGVLGQPSDAPVLDEAPS